jgi:SAM-dependent methyltransferase
MRYSVHGHEVRSENAAKPASDAASHLVQWLKERERTRSALDYGCGKLRYTKHMASRSHYIGVVDSEIQLSRTQRIHGQHVSVVDYVMKHWPRHSIQRLTAFWKKPSRSFGFVLCANVLSAIPCSKVRARSLRAIRRALEDKGTALFVNQHTNSYFTQIRQESTTQAHLDGWLTVTPQGASYYGILNRESVVKLLSRFGFNVEHAWVDGQSNYVLVSKGKA